MPLRPVPTPVRLGSRSLRYQSKLAKSGWQGPPRRRVSASSGRGESAANDDEKKLRRLEAVLFLAREPLNSRKLSQYATLADGTEARTLVRLLNRKYDQAGRAFKVAELGGGFQLLTRSIFSKWLQRLPHVPTALRLSSPTMETLAVVAYRQPVLRVDIEAIRGVSCGELLRQLMERDLVKIGGRSEELGRPYLYATTGRFLRMFGLRSLNDLPRADWVRNAVPPAAEIEELSEDSTEEPFTEEEGSADDEGSEEQASEKTVSADEKMLMEPASEDETSLAALHPAEPSEEEQEPLE
ncbi:SMC-Scp complex subunit ScpB [Lignipirellula cremea]|uniref:Segregation and condensation protein B n=1 Tax=Lignipirellula cremea TaxID=2528010 RepID=A0A518DZV6_9BACT|nr:SMC-Scp complex subunit ScpB [Lignipirellula cremea]QDU97355.1 Segregation and condensation protein B [Lignipirellula cremea]